MKNEARISTDAAHKRWWQIFEVVFGVPLLIAIMLQVTIPFSLPRGFFTPIFLLVGILLSGVGIVFIIRARQEFARHNQSTEPGVPTSKVITTGVFSISRNPLYLGGVFVLTGIALVLNLPWVLVLLLPALLACHYILIAPEERYLAVKFGEEYYRYTASVHRWIGRSQHQDDRKFI